MTRPAIESIYPTVPSQQGFIIGYLANPEDSLFVEQAALPLAGALDPERFRRVWREMARRHPVLRTAFAWNLSDTPRQVVMADASLEVEVVDARGLPAEDQDRGVREILERHRSEPFDLTRPPLLRVALQRRAEREHVLVWTHHHAILDGWSQASLINEMIEAYRRGCPAGGAPPPFGKYASWAARRDPAGGREFWREALGGYAPPAPFPARRLPPGTGRFGFRVAEMAPAELAALDGFARENDVTTPAVLVAVWSLVAARMRGAGEVVVGVTVSGRPAEFGPAREMIGPFVNTVPHRGVVEAGLDFGAWARSVQHGLAAAVEAGDGSAGEVHEWAGLPADRPLFDSVVAIANYPPFHGGDADDPDELRVVADAVQAYGGRTLQPLALVVTRPGGLAARLVNDRTRVVDDIADQLAAAFRSALARLRPGVAAPRVGDLLEGLPFPELPRAEELPAGEEAGEARGGTMEAVVAEAFARVLGRGHVAPGASFLSLGGHSMLALRLLAALRDAFAVDLTLQDLFADPTPAAVARRIGELAGAGAPPPEPLPRIQPAAGGGEPFPLSEIQSAYWVGRQPGFQHSEVDSHIYAEVDLPELDVARFEHAWRRLVDRHPMLRAVITPDGRQRVLERVEPYSVAVADASGGDSGLLASIRERLSHARREVTEWPLFTIEAARLPGGDTRLFLSFDLLIGDAQSWRILYHELRRLYREPDAELEPLEITFRDYVLGQSSLRETAAYRRARDYWRARLDTLPSPPELPLARRTGDADTRFVRRQLRLDAEETRELRRRAAALGATPSTFLMAVFSEVLGRFTGSSEFLLNLTLFNRLPLHPQVGGLVGDFTSLLLAAVSLEGGTFADRVRRLQRRLWSDLDHRLYSGLEVLRDIGARDGNPMGALAPVVFTSTLDLERIPGEEPGPIPGTIVHAIGQTPQVTFDYQTYEADGEIVINWDTVEALFPPGYLDPMFEAHNGLLRALIADPRAAHERALLAAAPQPEPADPPLGGSRLLHHPFLERARSAPDAVAVVSAGRRLTYRETLELAVAAAERIGDTPAGAPVAIVMEKGWEQVVAVFGALLAGRAFVPIEASWPPERAASLLEATSAAVVLTQSRVAPRLPAGVRCVSVDELAGHAVEPPADSAAADDLAYVIFTSGSTGAPKGVMIQHGAALNTVLDVNARFGVGPDDRVLALSPLSFDLSIYDIFGVLGAGGTLVMPSESDRRDPARWARLVADEGVTLWNSVPVLMELLAGSVAAAEGNPLRSLRLCMLSGDWIPLSLPGAIRAHAPGAKVVSLGGATEGSIWSILYEIGEVDPAWTSIPYGRSMTGQCVQVLAPDLTPCPAWVPGQIFISGHGVALGYWGEPGLTGEAFVRDAAGRRLYRTGDWGRLRPDGAIEFLGRRDDQVKVDGHRVELREVEAALAASPGVGEAAVVAVGDRSARRLAGFVTGSATAEELRDHLATRLPIYMVPTLIQVVDALPLSATGKVDRGALARRAESAPRGDAAAPAAREVDPALREAALAVLGCHTDPDACLLDLGLTSVDAIRLMNAIEWRLGVRPSIEAFYRDPSLRGLGRAVEAARARAASPSPAAGRPSAPAAWNGWKVLADPADREAFRAARPAFPLAPEERFLPADAPDEERYARRRSPRAFESAPVPLEGLGRMLRSLRAVREDGRTRFLYPSAGGLYGVDVYLHLRPGRVEGLGGGLYYYHPESHDLVPVVADIDLDAGIHAGMVNRPVAESAALTVFLVTDPAHSAPLYGADAEPLALLNAGYIGQALCDGALQAGLGLCPLHGYDFDRIRWLFPQGSRTVLLHLLAGGIPAEAPSPAPAAAESRGAATVSRTAPISPGQERLLYAEYVLPDGTWPRDGRSDRLRPVDIGAVLVEGALDADALRRAVDTLVERQSVLRTTFRFPRGAPPVQVVMPPEPRDLRVTDVGGGEWGPAELARLVDRHGGREAHPTGKRLFDVELVRLGHERHVVLLHVHHLVSDGWSLGVLYRELSEIYNAALEGREARLPPLGREFAEVCVRMHGERRGPEVAGQLRFWSEELRAAPEPLRFFGKAAKASGGTIRVNDAPVHVPGDRVAALKAASGAAEVPGGLAGPVLAALAVVIHAQTGAAQIDIGTMIAGRTSPDAEHLIGYFVNTAVIRLTLEPDMPLSRLVAQANRRVTAAMQNQDVPVQDVLEHLRGGGIAPRHRVTLALNGMRRESLTLQGARCTDIFRTEDGDLAGPREAPTSIALRWLLEECGDGLRGSLTYDVETFGDAGGRIAIEDLYAMFAAVSGPDRTVRSAAAALKSRGPAADPVPAIESVYTP